MAPEPGLVLAWHLATDLCFYYHEEALPNLDSAKRSREMSNYMIYMLLANPDMLLAGSTSYLLTAACKELEALLGPDGALDDTELLARRMIRRLRSSTQCSGLVGDAWALAQIMMGFNHQERIRRDGDIPR